MFNPSENMFGDDANAMSLGVQSRESVSEPSTHSNCNDECKHSSFDNNVNSEKRDWLNGFNKQSLKQMKQLVLISHNFRF